MKKGFLMLMFLTVFLLGLMLPHFADISSQPLTNKQHHVITFDGDSSTHLGDQTGKKIATALGATFFGDIETAVMILLLLAQCAIYLSHLRRRRLFIGPLFNQSNYVSHFS